MPVMFRVYTWFGVAAGSYEISNDSSLLGP